MVQFKNTMYTIPSSIGVGQSVEVLFEYEGDSSEIVQVQPNCGCTAQCSKEKVIDGRKYISCIYTDKDAVKIDKAHFHSHFPSGLMAFSKTITVFLQDNKDLYVIDGMDKKYNPAKTNLSLTFSGSVEVKKPS